MGSKTPPYFYNYYNYDSLTYSLVRLYGVWSNDSGTLTVRNNGTLLPTSWIYKNATFKVFVKLSPGQNDIVLQDNNSNTKSITLYYDQPPSDATSTILKLFLYDAFDGDGSCDAPPSRTDNTLNDNIKRLQMDGLLLQSFFAEAYRAARESQEGIKGLPFTTFNLEVDLNGMPIVHYIKSTNPIYERKYFWENGYIDGTVGLYDVIGQVINVNPSQKIYCIGYTLTSHKDPDTGKYGGGCGDGYISYGVMNSANLIWHAKDISEIQNIFDNYSTIDDKYNQLDNAYTVSDSYARVLGSLAHEFCHHTVLSDHPNQIIALVNKTVNPNYIDNYGRNYANPLNYFFTFDYEQYPEAFGIDMDDATYIRNWFMPYYNDNSLIPYEYSELGPSGLGWYSPFVINGYVNTLEAIKSGSFNMFNYAVEISKINDSLPVEKKLHYSATRTGFVNSPLLRPHPDYEYPQNAWSIYNAGYYKVKAPSKPTYCIAHIWGSGGGSFPFGYAAGFNYINTKDPNDSRVYLPTTILGGSGGYVKVVFPVNANDVLELVVGDKGGKYGGGGEPFLQTVYYGGFGGGKSSISLNNIPIAISGGGGGGSQLTPGLSVGQTTPYTSYNGKNGFLVTGCGEGNPSFIASGAGGGYYGGTLPSYDPIFESASFGSGAGSSYVSPICSSGILKNGVPVSEISEAVSYRSILPSIFMSPPSNIGTSSGEGCIILNFVYVSESRWNNININTFPLLTNISLPETDTNDSKNTNDITIIPRVKTINSTNSFITFDPQSTSIVESSVGSLSSNEINYLVNHMKILQLELYNLTGIQAILGDTKNTTISLIIDKNDITLQDSNNQYYKYNINIQNDSPQIIVKASSIAGLSHGTATLLQLIRSNNIGDARIGLHTITDYSDAKYSSILIDPARDPIELNYMKQLVDLCRFYKIRFLHIHGTDDQGWCFYLDPAVTDFTYNGSNYTLNDLNYPTSLWYGSKDKWIEFNNYAESRGISIVPEMEALGHFGFVQQKYSNIFGTKGAFDHGREIAYIAMTKIIDQFCITFPDTPYIFIGTDEATGAYTLKYDQDEEFFKLHPEVPKNNADAIINFFIYRINKYIRSKGKEMITWQNNNVNTSYANTNNTVIAQIWLINGGNGYNEDLDKYNIHGEGEPAVSSGVSIIQSPWWPRTFSPMKYMFNWTPVISTSVDQSLVNYTGKAIPVSDKVMGSCTLLWENHPHIDKLNLLRYKAPLRNENTYGMNRSSTSIETFSKCFNYLDSRFNTYLSCIRLIEDGLSKNIGDIMISNSDESLNPVLQFSKILRITAIPTRKDITIRYLITGSKEKYEYLTVANSTLYNKAIEINGYNPIFVNGFVTIRFQAFINNEPFGRIIEKYYLCIPFDIKVDGVFKLAPIKSFININNQNQYWFDNVANIVLNSTAINGTVRFNFIRNKLDFNSPILPLNSQIKLTGTTDTIFIALFDTNNIRFGGIYSTTFISNKDNFEPNTTFPPFPLNNFSIIPAQTISVTKLYKTSISIPTIYSLINNSSIDTVKISVIVIGGGGSSTSGGISKETYYDIPVNFGIDIVVGLPYQQSSISFNMNYSLENDRDNMKKYQEPVYPIIAYPGGVTQGMITKGDLIKSNYGYNYEGIPFGAPGYQGCVILKFSN